MNKKETIKLNYVSNDFWGLPIFEVENTKTYVKDINLGKGIMDLYWACPKTDPDGEPNNPFTTKKEIQIIGYNPIPEKDKFNYMMLSRLKSDCDYFLGFGNHYEGQLWAKSVPDQIAEMKKIWNLFSDDKKPEWLTWEEILDYEKKMLAYV